MRSNGSKPPSGPTRTAIGPLLGNRARVSSASSASSSQKTRVRSAGQSAENGGKGLGLSHLGEGEDAALFRRLNDVGAHPVVVDPRRLGAAGEDRAQTARPHLDGLLHHVIETRVFERREEIVQVTHRRLGAKARVDRQADLLASDGRERRPPLAVGPVEDKHGIAIRKPEYVAKVVLLVPIEREHDIGGERGIDVKSGSREVVGSHDVRIAWTIDRSRCFSGSVLGDNAGSWASLAWAVQVLGCSGLGLLKECRHCYEGCSPGSERKRGLWP